MYRPASLVPRTSCNAKQTPVPVSCVDFWGWVCKASNSLQDSEGGVEMTKSSGKPDLGSSTSNLEGVDKTAQKVMTGDMQKGGNKMGKSMKKEAKDKNLLNEDGDGKVCPRIWPCYHNAACCAAIQMLDNGPKPEAHNVSCF